jgi:hypothetical protein
VILDEANPLDPFLVFSQDGRSASDMVIVAVRDNQAWDVLNAVAFQELECEFIALGPTINDDRTTSAQQ